MTPSRQYTLNVHGLTMRVLEWGSETSQPIVMMHGIRGYAETFSGIAQALQPNHRVIAGVAPLTSVVAVIATGTLRQITTPMPTLQIWQMLQISWVFIVLTCSGTPWGVSMPSSTRHKIRSG